MSTDLTPIELNGLKWYSQAALCELLGKTDQTLRNWTKCNPPLIIKDESMGIKLYRLADGVSLYRLENGETIITKSPVSQEE